MVPETAAGTVLVNDRGEVIARVSEPEPPEVPPEVPPEGPPVAGAVVAGGPGAGAGRARRALAGFSRQAGGAAEPQDRGDRQQEQDEPAVGVGERRHWG